MKNFLFDLYGTLVDVRTDENSQKFIKRYERYFARLGYKNFWENYSKACEEINSEDEFFEPDIFEVFKKLAPDVDEEKLNKAAYTFRKYSRSKLKLYGGAKELLIELKKSGAKVYLVSNAQACFSVPELKKLKLYDLFDGIELSSDFGRKKPCKDFFTHALKKYGLDIGQSIYCGNDFRADVLGAKSAGLATAYINSNISPRDDDLEKIKEVATFATSDYKSLINYLLNESEKN
ncbi:MAG: HAD family hydrolase [Clostridia bacterium]|nr:HAD family hydrolase [Clostridia bacterium]